MVIPLGRDQLVGVLNNDQRQVLPTLQGQVPMTQTGPPVTTSSLKAALTWTRARKHRVCLQPLEPLALLHQYQQMDRLLGPALPG